MQADPGVKQPSGDHAAQSSTVSRVSSMPWTLEAKYVYTDGANVSTVLHDNFVEQARTLAERIFAISGVLLRTRSRFVRRETMQKGLLRVGKVTSHQPVTGVRIMRLQRLQDGFVVSLSERDAPGAEHARISIEAHERPDISVEKVDQAAISAGQGNLIMKVEVMPLAVHFREFVGGSIFLA